MATALSNQISLTTITPATALSNQISLTTATPLNVPPTPAQIRSQVYFGPSDNAHQTLMNYNTPNSFTANISGIVNETLAAGAKNVAFNLNTMFPNAVLPIAIGIQEITGSSAGPSANGFLFTTVSGSNKIAIGSSALAGKIEWVSDMNTAPGIVYLDNVSSTLRTNVQFYILSN
jgi:hypothetical protein